VRGLQDLVERSFELDVPPIDGADLSLTLDLDLQEEAAAVLAAPEGPPDPHQCDYAWLSRPTGAIVLMRVDGSVLAAASHPVVARDDRGPAGIADAPFERTLRKPGFQPPGSSFKPFVALWALDHIARTDPQRVLECAMLPDGRGAGYVDVRCNVHVGHGAVDLRDALKRSCNSYFAMLGERFSHADWSAMAAEFGFGQPTGVRALGPRAGLYEDSFPQLFQRELSGRGPRLAGNGLSVVEATPMQLARATAALASGALPDVRLVQRVGAQEFAPASRPIAISRASLEFVRGAMVACSNEAGGSARDALNASELGYVLAAKTGSGDIGVERVATADGQSRVRKHTWLVSYFPAHEPRYVLVVFCHDTLQTASHSSIWVARQFLQRPLVREFLAQDGGL
jgi:penicillin-binding protein 2